MEPARRHPDVFTGQEAIAYLHLDSIVDGPERTLETLRKEYGLVGQRIGAREYLYHRANLDAVVDRVFGLHAAKGQSLPLPTATKPAPVAHREPRLKMGGN